eukprot:365198-Chlamydomonas_euryale.AAC.9
MAFILPRLVFHKIFIAPTLPRAWLFDKLTMRKKRRGSWPVWRWRLASEAPRNAGDHLESCPWRFQHFPDGPLGFGQRQSKLAAEEICADLPGLTQWK